LVNVELRHQDNAIEVNLALDTGCTQTVLRPAVISFLGLSDKQALRKIGVTTGSRVDTAFEHQIDFMAAFGFRCNNIKVVSKDLPKGLFIDGLLGLDFFKIIKKKLILDFNKFLMTVE
jgi:hypothetical protein